MSDTSNIGQVFITTSTGTSAVNVGGSNNNGITCLYVNASGANAPAGTTLTLTDNANDFSYTFALELPTALLASYTGPLLSWPNLSLEINYGPGQCTAKLSNALSSGSIAINVGYM